MGFSVRSVGRRSALAVGGGCGIPSRAGGGFLSKRYTQLNDRILEKIGYKDIK